MQKHFKVHLQYSITFLIQGLSRFRLASIYLVIYAIASDSRRSSWLIFLSAKLTSSEPLCLALAYFTETTFASNLEHFYPIYCRFTSINCNVQTSTKTSILTYKIKYFLHIYTNYTKLQEGAFEYYGDGPSQHSYRDYKDITKCFSPDSFHQLFFLGIYS